MHVLVHIDCDLGPIGAWSWNADRGQLTQFYPESLDLNISGRARQLLAARPLQVSLPDWFLEIAATTVASLCDKYEVVVVPDNTNLIDIVSEYRRAWHTNV